MTGRLKETLARFKGKKILVLGDLMLDEYVWGRISRLSPEAPVQVVDEMRRSSVLGGAANTALNIKSLGGKAYLGGVVGNDAHGGVLVDKLKSEGIDSQGVIVDAKRVTTLKTRIMAQNQQIVRIDRETRAPISKNTILELTDFAETMISEVDGVVISDYDKGVLVPDLLNEAISLGKRSNKPVIVDPKGMDYSKYKNATVICPNVSEARLATKVDIADHESLERAGQILLSELGCKGVLVTRGSEGMSLFEKDCRPVHMPALASEVFDVTGAGDTAVAAFSLALVSGASMQESVILGNCAAGLAVRKVGTSTVEREELETMIEEKEGVKSSKIKNLEQLEKIVKSERKAGKKIVFTNGCFDILHYGHLKYLREAKKLGNILIVAVNSNSSVQALKGDVRPWVDERERAEILSALEFVDFTIIFDELTPDRVISALRPDIHVKGGDYTESDLPEAALVRSYGGEVVIIPAVENRSTTRLAKKIAKDFRSEACGGSL